MGRTDNLDIRIVQHQTGFYSGYTSKRLPVQLVYTKTFYSRDEALISERKIKKWKKTKKEALINGDWNEIAAFSKRTKNLNEFAPDETLASLVPLGD